MFFLSSSCSSFSKISFGILVIMCGGRTLRALLNLVVVLFMPFSLNCASIITNHIVAKVSVKCCYLMDIMLVLLSSYELVFLAVVASFGVTSEVMEEDGLRLLLLLSFVY